MRILWIEDKPEQIKHHRTLLGKQGHQVEVVHSGEAGIAAIRIALDGKTPYQAVLLDIMLPKGKGEQGTGGAIDPSVRQERMGEEVLRQMDEIGARWPVIAVSAIADDSLLETMRDQCDFVMHTLQKPVSTSRLLEVLSELGNKPQAQQGGQDT